MKKLLKGIVDFRENIRPSYKETFAKLALGQSPDALYIGCSDSRVAVNLFASTDPGDLFVSRNVGNLIPPYNEKEQSSSDESEAAIIEFALNNLNVTSIIVCGHSECGAIQSLVSGRSHVQTPNLKSWLRHGEEALNLIDVNPTFAKELSKHNRVSQMNVVLQIEHLKTYPIVQERLKTKKLNLHGWWFELKQAEVYAYEETIKKFVLIDDEVADKILKRIETH